MNNPLISVVMVVCNVDRFLNEAIESIRVQTFRDFEFIIADFGSTDNSKSIISSHAAKDARIKFHNIPHCGLAEARNAGCALAQGRYIAIMDADDVSAPDRLLWEVDFMEQHPEVGVIGGAIELINATGTALAIWNNPVSDREIKAVLLERCTLFQPTVLMRRDAFLAVGGYRPPFAPAEDYDLWLRMAEHYQIANLKQVVLRYRIHPYQVSMRKRTQQTLGILAARVAASSRKNGIPDPMNLVKEITPELLVSLGVTKEMLQGELTFEIVQWIRNMCMAGEYAIALQTAEETLQTDLKSVERSRIAELHLIVARLYSRQKKFVRCFFAVVHAVVTRPGVLKQLLWPVLKRFGL
jgi:glycosyltransferase involved in cell wall biosynthesis